MSAPPRPTNEAARLARLHGYQVLDTAPEDAFDRITRIASSALGVPISLVSLVDAERQWFKSRVGLEATETPRELAFCAHAICADAVLVVENAERDSRFADNPLVTGAPGIRFYAGAPLRTGDGFRLGTLCAIDTAPRKLDDGEIQLLQDLAAIVVDEMELRVQAERSRRAETRLIDAVEALADGFVLYDGDDRLVLCNQKYRQIYAESADLIRPGASFEEMLRIGVRRGQYPAAQGREEAWIAERLHAHLNPNEPIEQELPGNRWLRIEERRTREGGLVGFRVDITELKRTQQQLAEMAWTDSLTGVLSRRRFLEIARLEGRRLERYGSRMGLMLIDVDHFKRINDGFGHPAGDAVLQGLARGWRALLREHDHIGRLGGEEFGVLVTLAEHDSPEAIADRIRQETAAMRISHDGQDIQATVSIGYAICDSEHADIDAALGRADIALYEAKAQGRNRCIAAAAA